jgi:hypothetical protein
MRSFASLASLRETAFLPRLLALLAVALGAWRVASAWTIFSQTYDEPYHIACGLEWLDRGEYHYELEHPPLARLASAAGLWLAGYHSMGKSETVTEGNAILQERGDYWGALRRAREGNLCFYLTACLCLYLLARRQFGEEVAAWSTILFAHLPPVIAHARLATTDMACAAGVIVALYAFDLWLARPKLLRGIALGAAFAFGTLSKFSFLPFFAVSATVVFLLSRKTAGPRFPSLLAATAVFLLFAGAVYRFHAIDTTYDAPNVKAALLHAPIPVQKLFTHMPLGQIVRGIGEVGNQMRNGHITYLLGRLKTGGWWQFFPVVLFYKTPLGLWILIAAAILVSLRDPAPRIMILAALAMLCVVMPSPLELGVRHILPIYAPLSIASGFAVHKLFHVEPIRWPRLLALAALLWFSVATLRSWPNELSYFNELAGSHPEHIAIDSDLDWGQDLDRLRSRLDARGVHQFVLGYFGSADLTRSGLPAFTPLSATPSTGWIAVSVTVNAQRNAADPNSLAWLRGYQPLERIGSSYDLYWIYGHLRPPPDAPWQPAAAEVIAQHENQHDRHPEESRSNKQFSQRTGLLHVHEEPHH